ncbi:phosphoglycolate phosphatase [Oricola sp.]|uniref:phosphoglycolate phosphatase n=1 Tax=Oricola sp. TaxID=1979950 RepID=UPI003BA8444F
MSGLFDHPGARCGWPEALLFDLDGTLVDSVPDLTSAINMVLSEAGHAPLAVDQVRAMIGNGIAKLVERAFAARAVALQGADLAVMTDRMMAVYGGALVDKTVPMPGAAEILRAYAAVGVRIAVVTNKPEAFSREILAALGLAESVGAVVGGDTGPARKPAPGMLAHALQQLGVSAPRAAMVGDSPADIDAARAVPMASIAMRGGYTSIPADDLGADAVIDTLADLPQAIEALKEFA